MKQEALMRRGGWEPAPSPETADAARRDVEFLSGGVICRAWLYEPAAHFKRPAPCIVMAHGLGGTRACALDPYARAFAAAGFYVVLFDYRCLGDSDGAPRQVVSLPRQLEDWAAAIRFARALPAVDPARIGLWGTSLSGGHVITVAARDPEIAAVSAQCPMVDGRASVYMIVHELGWGPVLRLGLAGLVDKARALFGLSPYYVPLIAPPGGFAAMASHDAYDGLSAIVPPTWRNEIAARIFLSLRWYRPRRAAKAVKCPALIIACQKDSVTSPKAAVKAAQSMGDKARLIELPIGHFDIYLGEWFERSSAEQVAFFKQALNA
jgi:pimeloyl-ACP methyl ester carboxylesterase